MVNSAFHPKIRPPELWRPCLSFFIEIRILPAVQDLPFGVRISMSDYRRETKLVNLPL
jgi:hypothetical protein